MTSTRTTVSRRADAADHEVVRELLGNEASRVAKRLRSFKIDSLFPWQEEALEIYCKRSQPNFLYTAPTSGGKSLVADLILFSVLLGTFNANAVDDGSHQRKSSLLECSHTGSLAGGDKKGFAIILLPFVALVKEKHGQLSRLFANTPLAASPFYFGSQSSVLVGDTSEEADVAVCTVEKGCQLIHRMVSQTERLAFSKILRVVVVDEFHTFFVPSRGDMICNALIQLRLYAPHVTIVGMSATFPNISSFGSWLNAAVAFGDLRPTPLYLNVVTPNVVYKKRASVLLSTDGGNSAMRICGDSNTEEVESRFDCGPHIEELDTPWETIEEGASASCAAVFYGFLRNVGRTILAMSRESDILLPLYSLLPIVESGHSVLLFCPSKNEVQNHARRLALVLEAFKAFLEQRPQLQGPFARYLASEADAVIHRRRATLTMRVAATDGTGASRMDLWKNILNHGVAFHHSALSNHEKGLVEDVYRENHALLLVATSTLAAGVNLPAHRVVFSRPYLGHSTFLSPLDFQQMSGRAGRTGQAAYGEAFIICEQPNDVQPSLKLVIADLNHSTVYSTSSSPHVLKNKAPDSQSSSLRQGRDSLIALVLNLLSSTENEISVDVILEQMAGPRLMLQTRVLLETAESNSIPSFITESERNNLQAVTEWMEDAKLICLSSSPLVETCTEVAEEFEIPSVHRTPALLQATPLGRKVSFSGLKAREAFFLKASMSSRGIWIAASDLSICLLLVPYLPSVAPFLDFHAAVLKDRESSSTKSNSIVSQLAHPFAGLLDRKKIDNLFWLLHEGLNSSEVWIAENLLGIALPDLRPIVEKLMSGNRCLLRPHSGGQSNDDEGQRTAEVSKRSRNCAEALLHEPGMLLAQVNRLFHAILMHVALSGRVRIERVLQKLEMTEGASDSLIQTTLAHGVSVSQFLMALNLTPYQLIVDDFLAKHMGQLQRGMPSDASRATEAALARDLPMVPKAIVSCLFRNGYRTCKQLSAAQPPIVARLIAHLAAPAAGNGDQLQAIQSTAVDAQCIVIMAGVARKCKAAWDKKKRNFDSVGHGLDSELFAVTLKKKLTELMQKAHDVASRKRAKTQPFKTEASMESKGETLTNLCRTVSTTDDSGYIGRERLEEEVKQGLARREERSEQKENESLSQPASNGKQTRQWPIEHGFKSKDPKEGSTAFVLEAKETTSSEEAAATTGKAAATKGLKNATGPTNVTAARRGSNTSLSDTPVSLPSIGSLGSDMSCYHQAVGLEKKADPVFTNGLRINLDEFQSIEAESKKVFNPGSSLSEPFRGIAKPGLSCRLALPSVADFFAALGGRRKLLHPKHSKSYLSCLTASATHQSAQRVAALSEVSSTSLSYLTDVLSLTSVLSATSVNGTLIICPLRLSNEFFLITSEPEARLLWLWMCDATPQSDPKLLLLFGICTWQFLHLLGAANFPAELQRLGEGLVESSTFRTAASKITSQILDARTALWTLNPDFVHHDASFRQVFYASAESSAASGPLLFAMAVSRTSECWRLITRTIVDENLTLWAAIEAAFQMVLLKQDSRGIPIGFDSPNLSELGMLGALEFPAVTTNDENGVNDRQGEIAALPPARKTHPVILACKLRLLLLKHRICSRFGFCEGGEIGLEGGAIKSKPKSERHPLSVTNPEQIGYQLFRLTEYLDEPVLPSQRVDTVSGNASSVSEADLGGEKSASPSKEFVGSNDANELTKTMRKRRGRKRSYYSGKLVLDKLARKYDVLLPVVSDIKEYRFLKGCVHNLKNLLAACLPSRPSTLPDTSEPSNVSHAGKDPSGDACKWRIYVEHSTTMTQTGRLQAVSQVNPLIFEKSVMIKFPVWVETNGGPGQRHEQDVRGLSEGPRDLLIWDQDVTLAGKTSAESPSGSVIILTSGEIWANDGYNVVKPPKLHILARFMLPRIPSLYHPANKTCHKPASANKTPQTHSRSGEIYPQESESLTPIQRNLMKDGEDAGHYPLEHPVEHTTQICRPKQALKDEMEKDKRTFNLSPRLFVKQRGRVILTADYSQLEFRILTHYSDDRKLRRFFQDAESQSRSANVKASDLDVFTFIARNWLQKEAITAADRQIAKTCVYGLLYGMSPRTLADRLAAVMEDVEAGTAAPGQSHSTSQNAHTCAHWSMLSPNPRSPSVLHSPSETPTPGESPWLPQEPDRLGELLDAPDGDQIESERRSDSCSDASEKEASQRRERRRRKGRELCESFFGAFPETRHFLEFLQASVLRTGCVETLSGRRRYWQFECTSEMASASRKRGSGGPAAVEAKGTANIVHVTSRIDRKYLRQAVCQLCQGSASDIMKVAAIELDAIEGLEILLQIHDEFIFSVEESQLAKLLPRIRKAMCDTIVLRVPLEITFSVGESWGTCKPLPTPTEIV